MAPIYGGDQIEEFADELKKHLKYPPDSDFVDSFEANKVRISKTLFDNIEAAIKTNPQWILLDNQKLAYNKILDILDKNDKEKHLILIEGGPGTGKSIIAMQLMGELARKKKSCVHITNSSSFTTVMKAHVMDKGNKTWGSRAINGMFKLSHNWVKNPGDFDVAICDEAHRFRSKTTMYPYLVSNIPQAEEIMEHINILIAFIDEKQILRKLEWGTKEYFIKCAIASGVKKENIHGPITLDVQFRCAGNAEFVKVLDKALYEDTSVGFNHENFEIKFFPKLKIWKTILMVK